MRSTSVKTSSWHTSHKSASWMAAWAPSHWRPRRYIAAHASHSFARYTLATWFRRSEEESRYLDGSSEAGLGSLCTMLSDLSLTLALEGEIVAPWGLFTGVSGLSWPTVITYLLWELLETESFSEYSMDVLDGFSTEWAPTERLLGLRLSKDLCLPIRSAGTCNDNPDSMLPFSAIWFVFFELMFDFVLRSAWFVIAARCSISKDRFTCSVLDKTGPKSRLYSLNTPFWTSRASSRPLMTSTIRRYDNCISINASASSTSKLSIPSNFKVWQVWSAFS